MMNIRELDGWLIQQLEKVCHCFQRWTGKTNFWLAAQAARTIVLLFVGEIVGSAWWNGSSHVLWFGERPTATMAALDLMLIVFYGLAGTVFWKQAESEAYGRLEQQLANPEKIRTIPVVIRMGLLLNEAVGIPAPLLVHAWHWDSEIMGALMAAYFFLIACDPLPPCTAKISLKSLFAALNPQTVESR